MNTDTIRVAVIGAGMAGRAHAAGYRTASTLYDTDRPAVELAATCDLNADLAEDMRARYGYGRAETDWRAIAEADDIDAVSVVVANHLHREMIETLLAAGKHVLCEKPLAPTAADGQAMVAAAARTDRVAAVGYTYRRSPAAAAIREQIVGGTGTGRARSGGGTVDSGGGTAGGGGPLGAALHVNGHAWYDYALDPMTPMSWRYRGGLGSGILADTGSHIVDLAEFVVGSLVTEVSGATFATVIPRRPIPVGQTIGHTKAQLSGEFADVENEDIVTFTARFASGTVGTFSTSRVAHGLPNGLGFEVFCRGGSAAWDLQRAAEFTYSDDAPSGAVNGHRRVFVGPDHPYIGGGVPMVAPGVGVSVADMFAYQARGFLDQIAGIPFDGGPDGGPGGAAGGSAGAAGAVPPCATLAEGVHGLRVLEAVVASAKAGGRSVRVPGC